MAIEVRMITMTLLQKLVLILLLMEYGHRECGMRVKYDKHVS